MTFDSFIKSVIEPADYCVLNTPSEQRLSELERLTLLGGAELGKAIARIAKRLTSFSYDNGIGTVDARAILDAAEFYSSRFSDEPHSFFVPPAQRPSVKETVCHGLQNGAVVDLSFKSAYEVQNPLFREEYLLHKENREVHARMWRHETGARATLIAVHGWTMGDQRLNSLAFLPGLFYQLGVNVVLVELPYHGRRRPKVSGDSRSHLFPSAHMMRTNEAMGQVISDLRELRLFLESEGQKNIGCIGMSLGAYASALWSGLDKLDFCIAVVPLVSMAELAWEIFSREKTAGSLRDSSVTIDVLRDVYNLHSPLTYAPKIDRERLLIMAGLWDNIVPSRQPKLLWDHWKRPKMHWLRGGHGAQFASMSAFEEVMKFLGNLGYTK